MALPEVIAIDSPPVGAGLLIVTVATEGLPPVTLVGLSAREVSFGAVTFSAAVAD